MKNIFFGTSKFYRQNKMASAITITELLTNQKCCISNNAEETTVRLREQCNINNAVTNKVIDYYDEALPKNDPKFLAPIRRWEKRVGFVTPIRWINTIIISLFHILTTLFVLYDLFMGSWPKWQAFGFDLVFGGFQTFGITAGAHRFWTHRSFKAKLPLRIIFMICFSMSGQNQIYEWVRDHRVHHKMSETLADPHDARRGFFFSHVGWLMMKKHPIVVKEGNKIDMSDVLSDPVVKFHAKYFMFMKVMLCFVIPVVIKVILWDESWRLATTFVLLRYMAAVNGTWSVNSFAHLWGNKPYDINIKPVENWAVSAISMGEGWHNYHHTFPWDYRAAEMSYFLDTTFFIDMYARFGWAYDLKKASPVLIKAIVKKKGHQQNTAN